MESTLSAPLPHEFVNLLEIMGYGNLHSMSELEFSVELQEYARTQVPLMLDKSEFPKYYGKIKDPKLFTFAPGYKILMSKLAAIAKSLLLENAKEKGGFKIKTSKAITKESSKPIEVDKEYNREYERLYANMTDRLTAKGIPETYLEKIVLDKSVQFGTCYCSCKTEIVVKKTSNRWSNLNNFTRHCESHVNKKSKTPVGQQKITDMVKSPNMPVPKRSAPLRSSDDELETCPDSPSPVRNVIVHQATLRDNEDSEEDFLEETRRKRRKVNMIIDEDITQDSISKEDSSQEKATSNTSENEAEPTEATVQTGTSN